MDSEIKRISKELVKEIERFRNKNRTNFIGASKDIAMELRRNRDRKVKIIRELQF